MKTSLSVLFVVLSYGVLFAGEDLYRKMVFRGVDPACVERANGVGAPGTSVSVEYTPKDKVVVVSYSMDSGASEVERKQVRDAIKFQMDHVCHVSPDEFVTIQKGEKLTTAADSR